jgi:hypothetical protein
MIKILVYHQIGPSAYIRPLVLPSDRVAAGGHADDPVHGRDDRVQVSILSIAIFGHFGQIFIHKLRTKQMKNSILFI